MTAQAITPDKDQIALLEPFERLALKDITLVATGDEAQKAITALAGCVALGFDTESKPTFTRDEVSTGPHIVQLSTLQHGWIFQLHDPACRQQLSEYLARPGCVKAGFGLGDDLRRIRSKLGIEPANVIDLNARFRQLGYRKEMGVKAAVAVLFNKRYLKSKKAATSNWANPHLTQAQLSYAANDAYAAMRVWAKLEAI
jgi:ribonuclease D